jgi:uncharacterized protein with PIN domain
LLFKDPSFRINKEPIRPSELRVVCDNMLGGLGKELRRCGVDTIILENEREHTEVAKVKKPTQILLIYFKQVTSVSILRLLDARTDTL